MSGKNSNLTSFEKWLVEEHFDSLLTVFMNLEEADEIDEAYEEFKDDEIFEKKTDGGYDVDLGYLKERSDRLIVKLKEALKTALDESTAYKYKRYICHPADNGNQTKDLYDMELYGYDEVSNLIESIFPNDEYKLIMLAAKKITKVCLLYMIETEGDAVTTYESRKLCISYAALRSELHNFIPDSKGTAEIDRQKSIMFLPGTIKALYSDFKLLSFYDQRDAIFTALCILERYVFSTKKPDTKESEK